MIPWRVCADFFTSAEERESVFVSEDIGSVQSKYAALQQS
ncbi:hypothetical protein PSE_p0078 (plasmid) [Pseudovibrio sp. FO-BEG1]|nr:hypothetical protein PSE_p0078 [Pseudovibrio sp. FO-BEG1]